MNIINKQKRWHHALLLVITVSLIAWITPSGYFQPESENEFIKDLKKKLNVYNNRLPEDRVYIQTDKPMYQPGDDIWFSAYVRDGAILKPSAKSDIIHVELISPKGTVEKKISIIAKNGQAAGDFSIDKEALGGMYKLRAYTNWLKNEPVNDLEKGLENAFVKEIQIQDVVLPNLKMKLDFEKKAFGSGDEVIAKVAINTNENKPLSNQKISFTANLKADKLTDGNSVTDEEGVAFLKFKLPNDLKTNDGLLNVLIDYNGSKESISRSIPIVLNTIQFSAFPEGGDMVAGLENVIAFKALNEFNKPADIEAEVINEKGDKLITFESYHQGMGAFKLRPSAGENYYVKIIKPEGITQRFKLPDALNLGYVLNVDNSKEGEVAVNINSSLKEELSLVAQVRGKIYYSTVIDAKKGSNKIIFDTEKMPIGVAQITLFDSKGIARAERLTFINKNKQLNISVETEKEKYLPREKVKMKISVKDEKGLPMPAVLSMAVVNDQLLSFADDRSGNILSQLLLQQDLKEKIEEPGFYFNNKEPKSDKALDYLLMTSGWRRFTWEKVIDEEIPVINYLGERAILSGTVYNGNDGKPMSNVNIKVQNGMEYETDENGKFTIKKLDLSTPKTLVASASGYYPQQQYVQNYDQNMVFYMYKTTYNYYSKTKSNHRSKLSKSSAEQLVPSMNEGAGMVMEAAPMVHEMKVVNKKSLPSSSKNENVVKGKAVKINEKSENKIIASKDEENFKSVADKRAERFRMDDAIDGDDFSQPRTVYYRARQFKAPEYSKEEKVETRTDFRNTIYWNPNIEIGYNGKKTIEFYASDDITSFRTVIEGVTSGGMLGRTEKNIYTQLPFTMLTKIPVEVATEDIVSIPLVLKNNTNAPLGGVISISVPEGLQELTSTPTIQTIMPGAAKTIYLDYKVSDKIGVGEVTLGFKSCGLGDAFTQKIKIVPKGFPVQSSFSAQELEKEYTFEINKLVKGSLKAGFTAFPNVVSDLMKGVEGILQEPYGCFEQTSCTAYPNAMVLDYLKSTESKDTKTLSKATDLLERGYKRLITFEASEKGYEWFGANPGHEGLTAYGLMEFMDMKKAGQNIDQKMMDRTAEWLMSHKDGNGGFKREKHAYHDFGRISDDILNAYIVYALTEAGYSDLKKEFETSYKKAIESKDPYMLAMMANAAYLMKDNTKAEEAMQKLISQQQNDGSFNGLSHSITYSQGKSLSIETTALSIMAIIKSGKYALALNDAVKFLVSSRSGSGVFSSTQGTILSLKALTEFAKNSRKTNEDGAIIVYVDGKSVAELSYKAGEKGAITLNGIEEFIKGEGKHKIKIKYVGVKTPLPYSISVNWNTSLPQSNKECVIDITTALANTNAKVGETVRLSTVIKNKKNEEVPSTMAIIGIPAGFTAQPWQLKELQDKNVFDYYEIKGNNIAVYYRGLPASAIKEINLDLKAEMPGQYDAPASSAYLYYTNEFKTWSAAERITVKKSNL